MLWAGRVRPSSWVRHGGRGVRQGNLGADWLWRFGLPNKLPRPKPYFYPTIHGPWHGPPSGPIWSQKGDPFGRLRTPFFARIWAPPTPPTGPLIIRQIGENLPTPLQLWCFLVDVFLKKAYPPGTPFFGQKTTPQNIPKAPEILAKIPPPSHHFFPNL